MSETGWHGNGSLVVSSGQAAVLAEVVAERDRQDAKWGVQDNHPTRWVAILAEEVGEAAKGALDVDDGGATGHAGRAHYREELIQVAAVAVAAVEALDRAAR